MRPLLKAPLALGTFARRTAGELSRCLCDAVDHLQDGFLLVDAKPAGNGGRVIRYANSSVCEMMGYRMDEIVGATTELFTGPATSRETLREIDEAVDAGRHVRTEIVNYRASGEAFWVELSIFPLFDDRGRVAAFGSLRRDITDQRRARADLLESEARLNAVVQQLPAVVWTTDAEFHLTSFSGSAATTSDVSALTHLGKKITELEELPSALHTAALRGERRTGRTQFGGRVFDVAVEALRDASGATIGTIGVGLDVTERAAAEERLRFLARHDPVTGLANHKCLQTFVRDLRASGIPGALLALVAIDRYGDIVAGLGVETALGLSCAFAQRLRAEFLDCGLIARSGEDFALVFERLDSGAGARVGERLRRAFAEPFAIAGRTLTVTASGALVPLEGPFESAEAAMGAALATLERIRRTTGDRCEFATCGAEHEAADRLGFEADFRAALERGDVTAHFQPIFDGTGRVVGAEALARWTHPEYGTVSPDRFVPLAERIGAIGRLTERILRLACDLIRACDALALEPFRVSINLGTLEFERTGIVDAIRSVLRECGVEPSRVVLEITERGALRESTVAMRTVAELRALGIHIAVDDFGTGFNSLSYLRHFAVDAIKIDRMFVDDITDDDDGPIAQSIIKLAHTLGLKVVAEGVTTSRQHEVLVAAGCDELQGFFYSQPLPPEAFVASLRGPEADGA